ncbi:hypothetical protein Nmel_004525 [Mimus melanotis]
MAETIADTRRLISKPQNLNDAYGPPSNFLEIDVGNPQTVGVGRGRFTTYEIRVKTEHLEWLDPRKMIQKGFGHDVALGVRSNFL